MKICLINPGFGQIFRLPPLGLTYIAAVLQEAGHVVNIIDTNFVKTWKQLERELRKVGPDAVGLSCMTPTVNDALNVAKLVKCNLKCPVILGGPHPTIMPERILCDESVDYVVEGEGEITIRELIQNLEEHKDIKGVLGVWYKENGVIKRTAPRPYIDKLDQIPFPARDLLPKEYFKYGHANLIASRGCPFNCSFCQPTLRKIFGPKLRFRSPRNVVDEMEHLKKSIKIGHVKFEDDTFTINQRWVLELCDEMKERSLTMRWDCNSRVNTVNKNLLLAMKDAGCTRISFGVESGSQKILNILNKGITIQDIVGAFRMCKEVGIRTHAYLMIGSPGETKHTIKETVELIHKIDPDYMYISITTPLPMTKLYEDLTKSGMITAKNWDDFDYSTKCSIKLENLTSDEIFEIRRRITQNFWLRKVIQPGYIIRTIKEYPSPGFLWERLSLIRRLLWGD